jgi:hypothetical protein
MVGYVNKSVFPTSLTPKQNTCGVYGIISNADGRIYVGGSADLGRRFSTHKYDLSKREHCNPHLQRLHDENPSSLEFFVIEEVQDNSQLRNREQFWMDFYKSYLIENGFNTNPKSDSSKGYKHQPETLAKSSLTRIKNGRRDNRAVIQMDFQGNEIAKFKSITEAANSIGIVESCVRRCCNGERNHSGGFKWKYADSTK